MFYHLFAPLADDYTIFNLFRYLTFRTGGAVMTAMLISFIVGPYIIGWLRFRQARGQPIRVDGPKQHIVAKQGTPTMGGFLILIGISSATLLWADLTNEYVWVCLLVTTGFGIIGFIDDYLKVTRHTSSGISPRMKLFFQFLVAATAAWWISALQDPSLANHLALPFFKNLLIDLGWFFYPLAVLYIAFISNAVNLTDGLDGLAIMPVIIASATFMFIAYLVGNAVFSEYLQIHGVQGSGEITIFCGSLIGAGLGFLWFNAPPAMVFMGDTGSLSLGGALGTVAVITKHEIVLGIVGGLFVLEAVSVMVQVASFKLTGKRVFRMAPLHHHFEEKGWAEPTIVIRFWIIAVVLALFGLATLKLR